MKLQTFIFGKDKAPVWFNDVCASGRAKVNYDEEGNTISATLHSPTGIKTANVGDSIIYTNSGLAVVPEEKAKKYGIQHKEVKEKEVKNEKIAEESVESDRI